MATITERGETAAAPERVMPRGAIDVTTPAQAGGSSIWTATRVVMLVLTVIETLLLLRFAMLLLGANADHPLVSLVRGLTDPLTRPFEGIFGRPEGAVTVDVAAILAILFFLLLGALVVGGVRAATGRRDGPGAVAR